MKKHHLPKTVKNNSQNKKQNQDFPNIPQTPKTEGTSIIEKKQVKKHQNFILTAEQITQNKTKAKNKSLRFCKNNNNSKSYNYTIVDLPI